MFNLASSKTKEINLPLGELVMNFGTLQEMFEIIEKDVEALGKSNVDPLIHWKIARINFWIVDNWGAKLDSKISVGVQNLYNEVVNSLNAKTSRAD